MPAVATSVRAEGQALLALRSLPLWQVATTTWRSRTTRRYCAPHSTYTPRWSQQQGCEPTSLGGRLGRQSGAAIERSVADRGGPAGPDAHARCRLLLCMQLPLLRRSRVRNLPLPISLPGRAGGQAQRRAAHGAQAGQPRAGGAGICVHRGGHLPPEAGGPQSCSCCCGRQPVSVPPKQAGQLQGAFCTGAAERCGWPPRSVWMPTRRPAACQQQEAQSGAGPRFCNLRRRRTHAACLCLGLLQLAYILGRHGLALNLEEGPAAVEDDDLREQLTQIMRWASLYAFAAPGQPSKTSPGRLACKLSNPIC